MRGVINDESMIEDGLPQVAFIGRSNVGKSSVINSLTDTKDLARSSSTPGRTQEVNFFLINDSFYLVDLPGYGYARGSHEERTRIQNRIHWYLLRTHIEKRKTVLIIDVRIGLTENDIAMLKLLEEKNKDIIIVANKIDKLSTNDLKKSLLKIQNMVGEHIVIPYSTTKRIGIKTLISAITSW